MKLIGVDIGGTQIKYGIVENDVLLFNDACPTPTGEYSDVLAEIVHICQSILETEQNIDRIGLAVPGVNDIQAGRVRYSNNLGWYDVPIADDLSLATGKPVKIANDAQCAALGEALFGAGKEYDRVAMFTIGTGVGGGFVKGKQLETDTYGAMAYIFGHNSIVIDGKPCNCGRKGCLEAYTSASALTAALNSSDAPYRSVKELFSAARSGEVHARKMLDGFLRELSSGVVDVANILRPQVIVIGGGVSASSDMIIPSLQTAVENGVYGFDFAPVKVTAAELGNTAGIIGAANL